MADDAEPEPTGSETAREPGEDPAAPPEDDGDGDRRPTRTRWVVAILLVVIAAAVGAIVGIETTARDSPRHPVTTLAPAAPSTSAPGGSSP